MKKKNIKSVLTLFIQPCSILILLLAAFSEPSVAAENPGVKQVLVFSKAASWEQSIIHRDGNKLSYIEMELQKLGEANGINFTFTKDGTFFTSENIAKFDAFFFFTSGDMTSQKRYGRGDNFPLMTLEGKKAFLDSVRNGKGFIACNTGTHSFMDSVSPGEPKDEEHLSRYTKMLGAFCMGHNDVQEGHFTYMDKKFPGMERVPDSYTPFDQWYTFKQISPDLHVILALDSPKLHGNLYGRPSYPVAWARMEGKGRVYCTSMGHDPKIWKDPTFLQMLLGGIQWADGTLNADIPPDVTRITPQANEIPPSADHYVAGSPPVPSPKFPNYMVHLSPDDNHIPAGPRAPKRILFFSKSSGYEPLVSYRSGAYMCFLEETMLKFGRDHNIDFTFSKDGTYLTPENIEKFDGFLFYTSGDLLSKERTGLGDNYEAMTPQGKEALLLSIRNGKGFVGVHCAIDTFNAPTAVNDFEDPSKLDSYGKMLGADCIGYNAEEKGSLIPVDKNFPGMDHFPADFAPMDTWYSLKHFLPDLHVILALDGTKMKGNLYHRAPFPIAWARMEGKGRVFYTSLGRGKEIWNNPLFQEMLLGGIRWTTGEANADLTPNLKTATPQAHFIPLGARKPVEN
ncbi:MAG: ThuA domain-containing protein [Verrucomicrobiota bacterium]